jgi:hypothetical protein
MVIEVEGGEARCAEEAPGPPSKKQVSQNENQQSSLTEPKIINSKLKNHYSLFRTKLYVFKRESIPYYIISC